MHNTLSNVYQYHFFQSCNNMRSYLAPKKLQYLKLSKNILFKFHITNIDNIMFQVTAVTSVLLKTEILGWHYVDRKET